MFQTALFSVVSSIEPNIFSKACSRCLPSLAWDIKSCRSTRCQVQYTCYFTVHSHQKWPKLIEQRKSLILFGGPPSDGQRKFATTKQTGRPGYISGVWTQVDFMLMSQINWNVHIFKCPKLTSQSCSMNSQIKRVNITSREDKAGERAGVYTTHCIITFLSYQRNSSLQEWQIWRRMPWNCTMKFTSVLMLNKKLITVLVKRL